MNELERESTTTANNVPASLVRTGGSTPVMEMQEAPSLLDYWRVIKNHKWKILACCVTAIMVALIYVLSVKPTYTAWAMLLIEPKGQRVVKFEEMLSEPIQPGENEYYQSQFEMLKSRSLAAEVIKSHGLEQNQVFAGTDQEQNFAQRVVGDDARLVECRDRYDRGQPSWTSQQRTQRVRSCFGAYRHLPGDARYQTREAQPARNGRFQYTRPCARGPTRQRSR